MKKRLSARFICFITASIVLCAALVVSALGGSAYEVLKNAVFASFLYENATMDVETRVYLNGELYYTTHLHAASGEFSHFTTRCENSGPHHLRLVFQQFNDEPLMITSANYDNYGNMWYQMIPGSWGTGASPLHTRRHGNFMGMHIVFDMNTAQFRFLELLLDTTVGDLKNLLTMSTSGGVRTIRGSVTYAQLPELARLAIAVYAGDGRPDRAWAEWITPDFFQNTAHIPARTVQFNHANVIAEVDSSGNLIYLNLTINTTEENIFGDINDFERVMIRRYSNIGTTNPQNPFPQITPETVHDFIYQATWTPVYFKLNPDGTVNLESMRTIRPREITGRRMYLVHGFPNPEWIHVGQSWDRFNMQDFFHMP